jgi:hypothetical protein
MANPIAVPGTVVPSGSLTTPGGAQGIQGPTAVSADPGNIATIGSDSLTLVRPSAGFVTKTSAYTLTVADSNKYIICSGGSWTLTLPTAAVGFCVYVRNDMGISGTTGTITIARAGSATIDGLTSLALLPCQDCLIISDGTNWRTSGLKREVILGTQDITSSTANATVLLPAGFRYFELIFTSFQPVTSQDVLRAQFSIDGGTTWLTGASAYLNGFIYPSSATAVAYQATSNAFAQIGCQSSTTGQTRFLFYPGTASRSPSWISDSEGYNSTLAMATTWRASGLYNGAPGIVNALQYFSSSSNIANSFLTVKGVV